MQVLLVVSGGANVGRLPIMSLAFFFMLKSWLRSVSKLATFTNCSMTHVDETMEETADANVADNDHQSAATHAPASSS